jgi:plastocyanin
VTRTLAGMRPALALIAAAALSTSACGERRGEGARTSPAPVGTGSTTVGTAADVTVPVSLTDFRLPRDVRVPRSGLIAFEATNDGQSLHALAVVSPSGQARTQTLRPGERTTVEVRLPPGTYKWYCPVDDHERRGMVGRVRVAE